MIGIGKRELCLWVVGGKDGRVRKLRFTVRALALAVCCSALVVSGFLFVASDYARVHLQKAETFFRLKRALQEKQQLEGAAQTLQSQVESLEGAKQKSLTYEQQIKARLDELSVLLKTVDPGHMIAPSIGGSKGKVITAKPEDGVGGAEIVCPGNGVSCSGVQSQVGGADPVQRDEEHLRARISPSALNFKGNIQTEERGASHLIDLLDTYIDTLRVAPIGLPAAGFVTSGFGVRFSPFHGRLSMHEGIDFSLPQGNLIEATADGVVATVEHNPTYGLVVDIAHTNRVVTRYAHLSKAFVREGERICRGEVLGLVGTSGRSTGPHLHYEVLVDGKARNPMPFIRLALELSDLLGLPRPI